MDDELRDFVRRRARDRCEYCLIPQEATPYFTFHVEHIVAKQHLDELDDAARLALACNRCNAYKGPNLSSVDPLTGQIVLLFRRRRFLGRSSRVERLLFGRRHLRRNAGEHP
ncbi:MAG: hypothetical protein B7Z74_02845 [Deltaproteobacteria bacterium 21-66-5]|nr:MAG: hypothetical protein B7Z74_02845 [Deltaproteobacteria bacterium 21-66-5]